MPRAAKLRADKAQVDTVKTDTARWAVKTNILQWATATPNVSAEYGFGRHWSVEGTFATCPFEFDGGNKKWQHWQTTAEIRYWLRQRLDGHFFGLHVGGGEYNLAGLDLPFGGFKKEFRYEGWMLRGGLTYGYSWRLHQHWNLEALVGLGLTYADYKQFRCEHCGEMVGKNNKTFFAPTRAALSLVYTFGRQQPASEPVILTEYIHTRDTVLQRIVEHDTIMTPAQRLQKAFPFLAREGSNGDVDRLPMRFRLNRSDIDLTYSRNTETVRLLKQAIDSLCNSTELEMTRITVTGYASPEGPVDHNYDLSDARARALAAYIVRELEVCDCKMETIAAGENWYGLRELVKSSDMVDKDEVLQMLDAAGVRPNVPGPVLDKRSSEQLKARLQRLRGGRTWRSIQDVLFPQLRDASYLTVWFREKRE